MSTIKIIPNQPNKITISGNDKKLKIVDSNSSTSVNLSPSITNIVSVAVPGPTGPQGATGPAYVRQSEYSAPYSYNGKAPEGSSTSENVWTITRLTIAEDGTTTTGVATNVAWDDRATVPYS